MIPPFPRPLDLNGLVTYDLATNANLLAGKNKALVTSQQIPGDLTRTTMVESIERQTPYLLAQRR